MIKKLMLMTLIMSWNTFAVSVGTVNMQKILVNIKEGKRIQQKLQKLLKTKDSQIMREGKALQVAKRKFDKDAALFSKKKRAKQGQKLEKQFMALQEKRARFKKELALEEQKLSKPLLEKVKTIVDQISSKSGVDLTIEVSTTPLLFAKNRKDLTNDIIKAYDTKFK